VSSNQCGRFDDESNVKVDVVDEGGQSVVVVKGEIDLSVVDVLWKTMGEAAVGGSLVLDVAGVTFMDSAGVNLLLRVRQRLGDVPEAVVLRHPSATVRRVLEMAGVTGCLTLDPVDPADPADPVDPQP